MTKTVLFLYFCLTFSLLNPVNAQRFNRPRPITIEDQILMKLDSIDMIYFSRMRSKDKFDARRRLDAIAQLVNRMENRMNERERELRERERILSAKERDLEEREWDWQSRHKEKDWDRNRDNDRDRDRDWNNNRDNTLIRVSPVSLPEFNQLAEAIDRSPYDQDKKKIVKTAAVNNFFMIDQVIKIVKRFPFDTDKLDVIQILYPRILDLDKNYLLYNCFTFSDSKNKLERFIQEYNIRR